MAAVVAVYANSFRGALVLDDRPWIATNPSIQNPSSISDLVLSQNPGQLGGRPLVSSSLAVAARPAQVAYLRPLAGLLATSPDDTIRNGAEALKLAAEAVKLAPHDPEQLGTLAAALAETGQFPRR
ncbi:MAG TPA: hypothetical protein VGH32_00355 [Pirellulales bacterium]